MSNNLIVIILVIIYSIILHFTRSLQRLGIHPYDRLLANISGKTPHERLSGNDFIYILGIVLSNACVIFVILAARYGTISYFTAMYGIGMLPMLLFTRYVMHEKTSFHNWLGIIIIITGSLLLGIAARDSKPVVMEMVKLTNLIYLLLGECSALCRFVLCFLGGLRGHSKCQAKSATSSLSALFLLFLLCRAFQKIPLLS
ncbi:MAG: hypothetical protein P9X26_06295 [Candidatus Stygibacter frigidus]|nr:hypothetical protein [Candidatus Stygibacter frigidus]